MGLWGTTANPDADVLRGGTSTMLLVPNPEARLAELNALAEDPTLWNDTARAQRVMQERTALEDQLNSIGRIEREAFALDLAEDRHRPHPQHRHHRSPEGG